MSGKTSIAVLGGGSWGTALAHLLAHAGHSVALLLRDTEQAAHINAHHENPRYLRGVQLHPGIRAVAGDTGGPEQAEVLAGISILVLSVPCQAMRGTLRRLAGVVPPDCVLVNTAKGIEVSELVTVERMVREELPGFVDRYAVLSGPSFALEVATCKPTAVVLGCRDERLGARLREVFATPWFRSYSSTDVPGVEFGGAIKNLAMGCAPQAGKIDQHGRNVVIYPKCIGCGQCVPLCPRNALSLEKAEKGRHAVIDKERCIGCYECVTACKQGATLLLDSFWPSASTRPTSIPTSPSAWRNTPTER